MKFQTNLIKAKLIKRYKRFLADAVLEDGTPITAHCPNTGSMKTCGSEGDTIYLSFHDDPKRKLKYTWELTQVKDGFIGINTHRPNLIVKEALEQQKIASLSSYHKVFPERKRGESRLDFYLESQEPPTPCWVEVKNVTLLEGDSVLFPDAVSIRALKHVKSLEEAVSCGQRGVLIFLVNRPEGSSFKVAHHIDPDYAKALKKAQAMGVEILAYRAQNSLLETTLGEPIKVDLTFS